MAGESLVIEKTNNTTKICICMVSFIFIFIILIMSICWTNYDTFENFGNIVKYKHETMKNVLSGGFHYLSLTPNDDVYKKFKELDNKKKTALIVLAAPWCKYCQKLEGSGLMKKIAKKYPVLKLDDKHPQVQKVMEILQGEGFPTIGFYSNHKLIPYNGPREYEPIADILKRLQFLESKRNTNTLKKERFTNKVGKVIKVKDKDTPDKIIKEINKEQKNGKVCTAFVADWCGHCNQMKRDKILEKLAKKGVTVFEINDKHNFTKKLQIRSFPTLLCWEGNKAKKYEGKRTPEAIYKFMG